MAGQSEGGVSRFRSQWRLRRFAYRSLIVVRRQFSRVSVKISSAWRPLRPLVAFSTASLSDVERFDLHFPAQRRGEERPNWNSPSFQLLKARNG